MKHILLALILAVAGTLAIGSTATQTPANPSLSKNILNSIANGDADGLRVQLLSGADVNAKNSQVWTPLHFAAEKNRVEMAVYLISQNADINMHSKPGGTPLHEAASSGSTEMTALLLAKGADKNISTNNGKTPLDYAIEMSNKSVVTLLQSSPPVPKGRRIRKIVAEKFPDGNVYVGGTTGWRKRATGSGVIMDREFSYATPENDFKQSTIHPRPGIWNWELSDAWIKKCAEQEQVLRLHSPISPQCSSWAKDPARTPEELEQNLIEYTTAIYKRYDKYKHVKWIDVVNETVLSNGEWHGPGKGSWQCPWRKIGYDNEHPLKPPLYIKMVFKIATQNAPGIKLIINQNGGMQKPMWDKVKALVPYLREQGLRVDGIGWQAHISTGWEKKDENMDRLCDLIDWAHTNNLSFHVTEQNVWLDKNRDLNAQADTFVAILKALLERRDNGVVTWNTWNLSDRDAWRQKQRREGCIFDRQYRAKPAYYAIQKLLENPPPAE